VLLAVHRQQAARHAALGTAFRPANREKPRMVPLGIRQNLLVVLGAEQEDDTLPAVVDCSDGAKLLV
jgi:hypothetical protein